MSDDSNDPFAQLAELMGVACQACGESNPRSVTTCEVCGAKLSREVDDVSLNLMSDSLRRQTSKIPMEESANLLRLKAARDGLKQGKLTVEDFIEIVDDVLYIVEAGLELNSSPAMKARRAKMKPRTLKVYEEMAKGATEMQSGLVKMLSYSSNQQLSQVETGLAQVEAGLWKIDRAQDLAIQNLES